MTSVQVNEKAILALIKFSNATEIGAKNVAREKEMEWEEKNNRAGKNQLQWT